MPAKLSDYIFAAIEGLGDSVNEITNRRQDTRDAMMEAINKQRLEEAADQRKSELELEKQRRELEDKAAERAWKSAEAEKERNMKQTVDAIKALVSGGKGGKGGAEDEGDTATEAQRYLIDFHKDLVKNVKGDTARALDPEEMSMIISNPELVDEIRQNKDFSDSTHTAGKGFDTIWTPLKAGLNMIQPKRKYYIPEAIKEQVRNGTYKTRKALAERAMDGGEAPLSPEQKKQQSADKWGFWKEAGSAAAFNADKAFTSKETDQAAADWTEDNPIRAAIADLVGGVGSTIALSLIPVIGGAAGISKAAAFIATKAPNLAKAWKFIMSLKPSDKIKAIKAIKQMSGVKGLAARGLMYGAGYGLTGHGVRALAGAVTGKDANTNNILEDTFEGGLSGALFNTTIGAGAEKVLEKAYPKVKSLLEPITEKIADTKIGKKLKVPGGKWTEYSADKKYESVYEGIKKVFDEIPLEGREEALTAAEMSPDYFTDFLADVMHVRKKELEPIVKEAMAKYHANAKMEITKEARAAAGKTAVHAVDDIRTEGEKVWKPAYESATAHPKVTPIPKSEIIADGYKQAPFTESARESVKQAVEERVFPGGIPGGTPKFEANLDYKYVTKDDLLKAETILRDRAKSPTLSDSTKAQAVRDADSIRDYIVKAEAPDVLIFDEAKFSKSVRDNVYGALKETAESNQPKNLDEYNKGGLRYLSPKTVQQARSRLRKEAHDLFKSDILAAHKKEEAAEALTKMMEKQMSADRVAQLRTGDQAYGNYRRAWKMSRNPKEAFKDILGEDVEGMDAFQATRRAAEKGVLRDSDKDILWRYQVDKLLDHIDEGVSEKLKYGDKLNSVAMGRQYDSIPPEVKDAFSKIGFKYNSAQDLYTKLVHALAEPTSQKKFLQLMMGRGSKGVRMALVEWVYNYAAKNGKGGKVATDIVKKLLTSSPAEMKEFLAAKTGQKVGRYQAKVVPALMRDSLRAANQWRENRRRRGA